MKFRMKCAKDSALYSAFRFDSRTPGSLYSIDSHDLTGVRPIVGAINESRAHGILRDIIPLSGIALAPAQEMVVKPELPEGTEFLSRSP